MGKGYVIVLIILGLCCLVLFVCLSESPLEQQLRHVYFLTIRARHYWLGSNLSTIHVISFLRGGAEEDIAEKKGKGEKVKEAMEKSFEKTKSTVEDSAKSAAKIAGDTVGQVKESLIERSSLTDPQDDEL